ncbi:hypothetical protein JEG43_13505, partial [Anoxybacillus sp. LAT_35]|uniref:hypothetical protein n=1 Tax=unclassified Anoxybacillus TaxID=2639704 RepID=UPI001EE9D9CB
HNCPARSTHASSSSSLLNDDRCVEATRRLFDDASLVAEVLPLNYTRIIVFTMSIIAQHAQPMPLPLPAYSMMIDASRQLAAYSTM